MKPFLIPLWPWLRGGVEVFGWATVVSLIVFTIAIHRDERLNHRRYGPPPIEVSPVAQKIAAKFSPKLQTLADDHKDEIVASAGNVIYRYAARQIFPVAVDAIPRATEIASDRMLNYLCEMPMGEVASVMIAQAKSRGVQVDYSVWMAAEKR